MNTTSLCLLAIIIVMASFWYAPFIAALGLIIPFVAFSAIESIRNHKSLPKNELVQHIHFL